MADKEKNMPIHDPDNHENEILNHQPSSTEELPEADAGASVVNNPEESEVTSNEPKLPVQEAEVVNEPAEEQIEPTEEVVGSEEVESPAEETPEVESSEEAAATEEVSEPEAIEEAEPVSEEEVPEAEPASEEEIPEEETTEEPLVESDDEVAEEPLAESNEEAPIDGDEQPEGEFTESDWNEEDELEDDTDSEDEDDSFDENLTIEIDADGIVTTNGVAEDDDSENFVNDEEEKEIDPEDLVIYDEVIKAIKSEGERLVAKEESLKLYAKHSKDAIKNFEAALKVGQHLLESNRDEKETPSILAGIIKICAQILEIKCNNLENYVRVKAYEYIKPARKELSYEIERYNDYLITYSSLTGEQLTRLSALLPEKIASGKSIAVIPVLSYRESYVQVSEDDELTREAAATLTFIDPVLNADALMGEVDPPRTVGGTRRYMRKAKKATKALGNECSRISKLLSQSKSARKRFEDELRALEARTPLAQRATDEYKNKVFKIGVKYGKQLSGIKTLKTRNAFVRNRVRLMINRLVIEREKLVIAYDCLREACRAGNNGQKRIARDYLTKAIFSYNKCAELCSKAAGANFEVISPFVVDQIYAGKEASFPRIAYKRELVETVGNTSRSISMVLRNDVLPDEQAYAETSQRIVDKHGNTVNTAALSDESAMEDRASAIAKVMIDALKDSADTVLNVDDLERFSVKVNRALKYFKRARRRTEKAMARAFDENGVITALVENLRVIANIIEVRRISIAAATRIKRNDIARSYSRALYKNIELYNGRAIDYMSIVGEQFSRISITPVRDLANGADKLKVPVITYKDNYIEVFPKDPLKDSVYEKPRLWRSGVYTPLLMKHYRLTENRAIETTVVNSPFVFDVMTDDMPAVSWWHPIGIWQHLMVWAQPIVAWWHRVLTNVEIWFVDESLVFSKSGLKGRERRNQRRKRRYESKIRRFNAEHTAAILRLETVVHETDRHTLEYQKKICKINEKYSRKIYRLKLRWMRECPGRNEARLMLERLVLERERLAGINKVILKYRNYGRITFTRNILVKYKKKFIEAITAHNNTAEKLSELIGVKLSQVSTSVAEEIIRYGNMIKFPEIVCCREVIETIDGKNRTVGDRWHGYGLYTGTSDSASSNANAPVMSVGAMGYATDMGVPFLKSDTNGMTMIGMTPGGVPLIGFNSTGETSIPFTGTPMMLSGSDISVVLDAGREGQDTMILGAADATDPYSGLNQRGVDARYTDDLEEDAKDLHSGCEVETPLDLQSKMIEERFTRALRARAMTSIDNVRNWWKLVGSEINVWIMRKLLIRPRGFLQILLPPRDFYIENVNTKVSVQDVISLERISTVGGIIDIECKRLYSATKTGVRRSQRKFSAWLHEDIDLYNQLVKTYNKNHPRHMHIELLSFNIPDTIRFRREDLPPAPPVFSMRNRVKLQEDATPILTKDLLESLVEYAKKATFRHKGLIGIIWAKLVTVPLLNLEMRLGLRGKALKRVKRMIGKRSNRAYAYRQENEARHYRIRYEKARSMKRYNRRTLRAIGLANDPIKYQEKVHKVLRRHLTQIFRIDYNMRIRQLIYRAMRVQKELYWIVTAALAAVTVIVSLTPVDMRALQTLVFVGVVWAALPIILALLRLVYSIVLLVVSIVLLLTRNIWLIKYGARDVERNRYGAILDCFVTEQYRLLVACERVHQKPRSHKARKILIAAVNDFNKRSTVYSEILRIPIKQIEITGLLEKLTTEGSHRLVELQNFVYVRELVERVDRRQRGKTLTDREYATLSGEINQVINLINLRSSESDPAVQFLRTKMEDLANRIRNRDIKLTQNERFELKRDLIEGAMNLQLEAGEFEIFAKNVITIVDHIGGKDSRRIIGVLASDDMII